MSRKRQVIVLIHGYLATWRTWMKLKPYLVLRGMDVHSPTLPYRLVSVRPDPFDAADYVYRYLRNRRIKGQIYLIGHSFGGLISKAFLRRYSNEFSIRGIVTLATPHRGVRWTRKMIHNIYRQIASVEGDEFARFVRGTLFYISRAFNFDSPIIRELNGVFESMNVRYLLLGADMGGIGSAFTPVGDGVVELDSQVPPEFVEKENVEHFVFHGVGHTQIQKIPQSRDIIWRFIERGSIYK